MLSYGSDRFPIYTHDLKLLKEKGERKKQCKINTPVDTLAKSKPDFRKWNHALLASMKDPALKVLETSELVVIKVVNM